MAARFPQAIVPVTQALLAGDAQAGAANAVGSAPLGGDRKIEKSQIGAGIGFSICVEQVVGADVILVDGFLDQPHTQQVCIKGQIFARFCGDGGQVVNPA